MKTLDKIVIIICIIAILGLLGSCDLKHTEINPVFKITKADDTEDEMNAWCDNSPECYDQLMQENELVKGLHFGQNLIEQIIYRFPPYNEKWTLLDLDKLAYAVSMQESSGCNSYIARMYNNCHGIRRNGTWQHYSTQQDSFNDFKDIWQRLYGGFPNLKMAKRYSGNDRAKIWLKNVTYFYNK